MGSIRSGRDGHVNGFGCIKSWSYDETVTANRYAASCTGAGTAIPEGTIDQTGQMSGIGTPPNSLVPGADVSFVGIIDGTEGATETAEGTVRINQLTISIPIEDDNPPMWVASFGVQGKLVKGSSVVSPDLFYGLHKGCGIAAPALLGAIAIPHPRSIDIDLSAPDKPYITNKQTFRDSGNLEGSITIAVYDDDPIAATWSPSAEYVLKAFIDGTLFWQFEWVRVTGLSGFVVNRETQELIGYTVNLGWTSRKTAGTANGLIVRPNGSALYGVLPA